MLEPEPQTLFFHQAADKIEIAFIVLGNIFPHRIEGIKYLVSSRGIWLMRSGDILNVRTVDHASLTRFSKEDYAESIFQHQRNGRNVSSSDETSTQ